MPISLLSGFVTVGNRDINRFVKSAESARNQGDQALEISVRLSGHVKSTL